MKTLQAHVYNQVGMDGVKKSANENVSSDKIKSARRGDAIALLGKPPVFIKKVPYQLQQLPFWDTSYYCDPADAGCVHWFSCEIHTNYFPAYRMDEIYSDNSKRGPGDFDTWDAPLRRKKNGEAQVIMRRNKRTRDQGVQTGVTSSVSSNHQSVLGQTTTASPHIQMPYRRELLDNQPKMMKKPAPRPMAVSASTVSISINILSCIFYWMRNLAQFLHAIRN